MATLYTDVADNQNDAIQLTKEREPKGSKVSGDVLFATSTYTFVGTEANADEINIVKLREGSTVIPHLCQIICNFDTGDETLDLSIGDDDATTAVDPDRYSVLQAVDAAGVGVEAFAFSFATAAAGLTPYELQADSWIQALLAGEANTAADDSITFLIAYRSQS